MGEYDSDLIDILVTKHAETEKGILLSDDGDKANAIWLPKSQIEIARNKDGTFTATMPEWLAIERGFV